MRARSSNRARRTPAACAAAVLWALCSIVGHAQQPRTDDALLRRLDALEQLQQSLLQQVRELQQQLADLRRAPGPGRPTGPPQPVLPTTTIPLTATPLKGDPQARVVILEYSDFQCPYCGAFARQTLPELQAKYIATGKVRLGFWNLPLSEIHPNAIPAAEAAECARQQGKFWEMHDALFADQSHLDLQSLLGHVNAIGLDLAAFRQCVQGSGATKVRQDISAARGFGLGVTPTFIVGTVEADGSLKARQLLVGAKDLAAFSAAIDPLLK